MGMLVMMIIAVLAVNLDVHLGSGDPGPHHLLGAKPEFADRKSREPLLQGGDIEAEIDQRPQRHIAADAVETVEMEVSGHVALDPIPLRLSRKRRGIISAGMGRGKQYRSGRHPLVCRLDRDARHRVCGSDRASQSIHGRLKGSAPRKQDHRASNTEAAREPD